MNIFDAAVRYFFTTPNIAVLLFPLSAILFLIWWYSRYASLDKNAGNALEWVRTGPAPPFGIESRGRLDKRDAVPLLCITALYAVMALFYLGDSDAPQNYWRADTGADTILIDLGEPAVIDKLYYFCGSFHGPRDVMHYDVSFSEDGLDFRAQDGISQEHSVTFSWREAGLSDRLPTRYIRITALYTPLELGELYITGTRSDGVRYRLTPADVRPAMGLALFDEQETVPGDGGRTVLNGAYFDEIYHARTAYEYLRGYTIYETTHPPLGKEIIAGGIALFGMTPFGWRIAGTLCGILMLPLFYLLIKQIFGSTLVSAASTAVWAADFMHLTQTRIATIDVFSVFFILLMFLFMHRWMTLPNDSPFLYTLPPLFMCGLCFGLGSAAKWTSIYAGFGLVALYVWKLTSRSRASVRHGRPFAGFLFGTLLFSLLFFIAVPALIYTASYIPYVPQGEPLTPQNVWHYMIENQKSMFSYHSALTETHIYQSRWYMWIADIRPVCYFYQWDRSSDMVSVINSFNNPILSWGGFAALVLCVADTVRRRSYQALFAVIGYASVLLPWMPVSRITFSYHYFSASMFLVVALAYVFNRMEKSRKNAARKYIVTFAAVCAAVFLMFYPALVGIPVKRDYLLYALQWMPSWPF